jgi:hypothetical protein
MHCPEGTVRYGDVVPQDEPFASQWGGLDPIVTEVPWHRVRDDAAWIPKPWIGAQLEGTAP